MSNDDLLGKVCTRCDKRPRCKECSVLLRTKNAGTCSTCVDHKGHLKYSCTICNRTMKSQCEERYRVFGNYCSACAAKCASKARKNKEESEKWLKDWLESICG